MTSTTEHGLAGIALLGLIAALWGSLVARSVAGTRRLMLVAGASAAVVSFAQVGFMIAIYVHVGQHGSAEGTRTLFNAINKADTVKLILLALFVGAVSWAVSYSGVLPRWVVWAGAVTVMFLVVGGLAFLVNSGLLNAVLTISLPLLLLWAASVSISMIRRNPRGSQPKVASAVRRACLPSDVSVGWLG